MKRKRSLGNVRTRSLLVHLCRMSFVTCVGLAGIRKYVEQVVYSVVGGILSQVAYFGSSASLGSLFRIWF